MNRLCFVLVALVAGCGSTSSSAPTSTASLLPPAGSIGESCVIDADCGSGMCDRTVPGGYCTRPCEADADCGSVGICDGGACLQRCTMQRECRSSEFDCFAVGRADGIGACAYDVIGLAPSEVTIGTPCRAVIECLAPEGLEAYCIPEVGYRGEDTGHDGGFCTALGCTDDASCGDGARCVGADEARYCAPACDETTPCRVGYACMPSLGVCLATP